MPQMYTLMDYNKIQTTLFWLDKTHSLVEVVNTYKKIKDNSKFFYSEYSTRNGSNIYMDLNYHLEITSLVNEDGNKNVFVVDQYNIYQFITGIKTIVSWLTTNIGSDLYVMMENGIIKVNTQKFQPLHIMGTFNTKLEISPSVRFNSTESEQIPGIDLYINNDVEPIFMDRMRFLNLSYFLDGFNMTTMAMNMINFLGRPEVDNSSSSSGTVYQSKSGGFLSKVGAKER